MDVIASPASSVESLEGRTLSYAFRGYLHRINQCHLQAPSPADTQVYLEAKLLLDSMTYAYIIYSCRT